MGYCISQHETNFNIKTEHKADALKAIKSLAGKETHKHNQSPHFSWVETAHFLKTETLEEALIVWRWHAKTDEKGNIVDLDFNGEKYGDCTVLFTAIAPYVTDGSFITMKGEDGAIFRWVFNNKTFKEQQAKVTVEWD